MVTSQANATSCLDIEVNRQIQDLSTRYAFFILRMKPVLHKLFPVNEAPAQSENIGAILFGQIHGLQKALKDDEELVVWFSNASEKLRVMEIFLASPKVAVLSGHDAERNLTRVTSPVDALQLVAKVMKAPPGAKPSRVGLIMPKTKDSNG